MPYFMRAMGMWFFPLLILFVVIVILAIKKAIDLFGGRDLTEAQLEGGLHAVLFWGVISAVVGFLGQVSGIYNALQVISKATEISPKIVAMGFAESFTSAIFGLVIFLVSAILWAILYARSKKLTARG